MQAAYKLKTSARILAKRMVKIIAAALSDLLPAGDAAGDGIFVLMYHRVNDTRKNELSVSVDQFETQLKWLRDHGFVSLPMADLETGKIPDRGTAAHIIFTFDDGYEDNYLNALPLLKKYGYTGMFYLATDYIGTTRMYENDRKESSPPAQNRLLNWDQVAEMLDAGMEIGSHTMNHVDLRKVSRAVAKREIFESKQRLEENLDRQITSFCYPSGYYNEAAVSLVVEGGYLSACTTDIGIWGGHQLTTIPRIPVMASDPFFVFKQKMQGRMRWFRFIH